MRVLVEGPSADSELVWQARLSTQAPEIDGVCYISDPGEAPLRAGEIRRMRITKAHDYDLTGELVGTPESPLERQLVQVALVHNQLGLCSVRSAEKKSHSDEPNSCPSAATAAGSSIWATGRRRNT